MTHHDCDWRTADPTHAIWSGSEPVGRTDCPPTSLVGGRRHPMASQGAHAPSTTNERTTAGTPDTTDHPIWSVDESTKRAGVLPASPVAGRRCPLARPGAPATLPARRTSTAGCAHHPTLGRSQANPRPSAPAEWSGRESAGRAASQRAGPVRACRWRATPLYVRTDRDCQRWAGRSTTATDRVVRKHGTISTRSDGGAA